MLVLNTRSDRLVKWVTSYKQHRQHVTMWHASHCTAGSHGSGVAQVLSVDDERLSGNNRSNIAYSNGDSKQADTVGKSNGDPGAKKASGVSLFGSYKAPVKHQ